MACQEISAKLASSSLTPVGFVLETNVIFLFAAQEIESASLPLVPCRANSSQVNRPGVHIVRVTATLAGCTIFVLQAVGERYSKYCFQRGQLHGGLRDHSDGVAEVLGGAHEGGGALGKVFRPLSCLGYGKDLGRQLILATVDRLLVRGLRNAVRFERRDFVGGHRW